MITEFHFSVTKPSFQFTTVTFEYFS